MFLGNISGIHICSIVLSLYLIIHRLMARFPGSWLLTIMTTVDDANGFYYGTLLSPSRSHCLTPNLNMSRLADAFNQAGRDSHILGPLNTKSRLLSPARIDEHYQGSVGDIWRWWLKWRLSNECSLHEWPLIFAGWRPISCIIMQLLLIEICHSLNLTNRFCGRCNFSQACEQYTAMLLF